MNFKKIFKTSLMATSLIVASTVATAVQAEGERIAFFVSDLSNVFHQSQAAEAVRYGKEKYGVEVVIFDGQADSAVMTQNVDQIVAGAFDGATLHIWDGEAATPGINDALADGIAVTSFFNPITDTGIPTARSDEAGVSFEMGAQMATAWIKAHPNTPIKMVQLGWPNHTEVNSGRTNPFAAGVLSVAPSARNLGALDSSGGQEAAKQIIVDLLTQQPDVNIIYSEASNLTVGTMAGLSQLGRGKFDNGKPLTEIVASVDFDTVEFDLIYDANSSLKVSMGLPPVETAQGRIDLVMDVINGKIAATSSPAEEFYYKAYTISYWSMDEADASTWLAAQFGG
ncbi:MAG: substrate-binding domain-containing protein [Rhizobiales bacterium]|nr:substrate-binding domain-containing protein [Hyphomicrobiales bacterium]NRB15513.1 substrate-binding domain-containing protein [Hyphomicrobiales bacterium]